MSSSLYKMGFRDLSKEATRVLDMNDLVAKRLEELAEKQKNPKRQGFVAGLAAETVELSELQGAESDEQLTEEGLLHANVIKAGEDAESIRAKAQEEADSTIENARAQAEQILADASEQAQREKEQVLAQAKEQGYAEGKKQADAEAQKMREQFAAKERQLEAEYQNHIDELEPKFVDTITGIYEHIFHVELQSYREILVHLISSTMRKVEEGRNFLIHVSKEDYPYVSAQKKLIVSQSNTAVESIEVIEDISLGKNQCLIETDGGIFDCGLGIQLSELGQKLRLLSYEK